MSNHSSSKSHPGRRDFIGSLAVAGAATIGLSTIASPAIAATGDRWKPFETFPDPEQWCNKIQGKHKMVFDCTQPHSLFPFAWPRVFLLTNEGTGSKQEECCAVVVLRHDGICYAFEDRIWEKYGFGEVFKADDPLTAKPATRNPFWNPKPGDYKIPGVGPVQIGINELQANGVMLCVCEMAITVNSAKVAKAKGLDAAEVRKDWMTGLLPGIQLVPSGVWALGRAQEKGCGYVFAG
jgi:intracellular sulfur oxidation DsrE/DsrF family protein